jgi:NAD(P)H-dependent FMN reductase
MVLGGPQWSWGVSGALKNQIESGGGEEPTVHDPSVAIIEGVGSTETSKVESRCFYAMGSVWHGSMSTGGDGGVG